MIHLYLKYIKNGFFFLCRCTLHESTIILNTYLLSILKRFNRKKKEILLFKNSCIIFNAQCKKHYFYIYQNHIIFLYFFKNSYVNFKTIIDGTANIIPNNPKNLPIIVSAMTMRRGFTFIHLDIIYGFMKLDSIV